MLGESFNSHTPFNHNVLLQNPNNQNCIITSGIPRRNNGAFALHRPEFFRYLRIIFMIVTANIILYNCM